jgi:hypothetical protein
MSEGVVLTSRGESRLPWQRMLVNARVLVPVGVMGGRAEPLDAEMIGHGL